jgi:hypothetical protein
MQVGTISSFFPFKTENVDDGKAAYLLLSVHLCQLGGFSGHVLICVPCIPVN